MPTSTASPDWLALWPVFSTLPWPRLCGIDGHRGLAEIFVWRQPELVPEGVELHLTLWKDRSSSARTKERHSEKLSSKTVLLMRFRRERGSFSR